MSKSVVSSRHDDCFGCRLVSGFGLLGMSGYISYHANKKTFNKFGRLSMFGIAAGVGVLGVTRLFNVNPFPNNIKENSD